jgi:hypothetical protein
MIESVKANLIWEDNPDTLLNSYNLSKMLDFQSESKFIHYTDDRADYEQWADLIIEVADAPGVDPFTAYARTEYKDKVIYNLTTHVAKKIVENNDHTFSAIAYNSPYKKLLKINSKTKISMSFDKSGTTYYNSFDIGTSDKLFSSDHLLTEVDFLVNSTYEIYLYYHIAYGDYAQIKIMNKSDSSWKSGGGADPASPSGYKIISYRKIGGFKTDVNGYINVDSVWDISTLNKEIIVESLKKYNSTTDEIRSFSAVDIPITDTQNIISASNVESALEEIKLKVDKMYGDLYTANRYGVDVVFCDIKKEGNSFVDCVVHDLTLKITAGYVDVYGERIKIENDVYLSSTSSSIRVNNSVTYATPAFLGDIATPNSIYDNSQDGSGTIWRIYIDINGKIILKEDGIARPQYYNQGKLKGWYDITSVARCIGKFKVKKSTYYFIEKQSVLNTIDRELIPNEMVIIHGTMCPDGTIPCDGKWHDTIGTDTNAYTSRPALSTWQSKWYEEVPNMWGRTIRMANSNIISVGAFRLDGSGNILSGGSAETGVAGGSNMHYHSHPHAHGSGTLKTVDSGSHIHEQVEFPVQYINEVIDVVPDPQSNSVKVTTNTHDHIIIVGGGAHSHNPSDFSGSVALLSGTDANTAETSSWAPYKEILFCIKK